MAKERSFQYRNTGTQQAPVWEKWFAITVADAVMMSDGDAEEKTIVDYVNQKIADLIGGAPATYDTLKEIADYIAAHADVVTALNAAIGNKVDKVSGKGLSTNDYSNAEKQKVTNADTNSRFTNATPTVNTIGGIAAGTTFDDMPVNQVLNKLLYPWVAPTVSASVTAPANGGTYELGATVNVTKIRVVVGKKSSNITKVEIFDGATSIGSKTDGVAAGGTFDFTVNINVTANKGFTAKVTDADGKVTSANTGSFSFVYPYYTGVVAANATINEATVKALTKKIEAKGNKTYSFTANNQKMVIAYPASYGNLSKIIDPNNFDVTGTFTKSAINITGLNGTAVSYNVYVNDASTVTNFAMKFNY